MITLDMYQEALSSAGPNMGDIRKSESDIVINNTFLNDPAYKLVYILTKDGWKFEDAKYQRHAKETITKDAVDYYLQFRPKVHYPIGSYVLVPDDLSPKLNLSGNELKNPFLQPVEKRTQWWMIVGRSQTSSFVRYNILQCNWNFKWVYDGQIHECFGCMRNANSYNSGVVDGEYMSTLENLTSIWLPDTHYLYGDDLENMDLCDTRTVFFHTRFMLTTNVLDPKVYQVTKVIETAPQGIIKYSLKQDEYDRKRDNVDLMICDYYKDNGVSTVDPPENDEPTDCTTSKITEKLIDENGELIDAPEASVYQVTIGSYSYFQVDFSDEGVVPVWEIYLIDENNEYTEEKKKYYEGLMKIGRYDGNFITIKPGKVKSLAGLRFELKVCDENGDYSSSIVLEVMSNVA